MLDVDKIIMSMEIYLAIMPSVEFEADVDSYTNPKQNYLALLIPAIRFHLSHG